MLRISSNRSPISVSAVFNWVTLPSVDTSVSALSQTLAKLSILLVAISHSYRTIYVNIVRLRYERSGPEDQKCRGIGLDMR